MKNFSLKRGIKYIFLRKIFKQNDQINYSTTNKSVYSLLKGLYPKSTMNYHYRQTLNDTQFFISYYYTRHTQIRQSKKHFIINSKKRIYSKSK